MVEEARGVSALGAQERPAGNDWHRWLLRLRDNPGQRPLPLLSGRLLPACFYHFEVKVGPGAEPAWQGSTGSRPSPLVSCSLVARRAGARGEKRFGPLECRLGP